MEVTFHAGDIVLLPELEAATADGRAIIGAVRVFGRLISFDAAKRVAVIEHKSAQLPVDTTLLPQFAFVLDSLFEFVGELQRDGGPGSGLVLAARVYRNVDGRRTDLFEKALAARRAYLAEIRPG